MFKLEQQATSSGRALNKLPNKLIRNRTCTHVSIFSINHWSIFNLINNYLRSLYFTDHNNETSWKQAQSEKFEKTFSRLKFIAQNIFRHFDSARLEHL